MFDSLFYLGKRLFSGSLSYGTGNIFLILYSTIAKVTLLTTHDTNTIKTFYINCFLIIYQIFYYLKVDSLLVNEISYMFNCWDLEAAQEGIKT